MLMLSPNPDSYSLLPHFLSSSLQKQQGGCDDAFKKADNRNIVATDTCKNTIYILARRHQFASIEEFGIIVAKHFLAQYPGIVYKADIQLVKDLWTRVVNKDSHGRVAQHNHAFVKVGPQNTYTQ